MTKLEELRAAYEAATPGRWAYDDDGFVYGDMDNPTHGGYIVSDPHSSPEADIDEREGNGAFITLAHNLTPQLIQAVNMLQDIYNKHERGMASLYSNNDARAMGKLLEKLK